ncbi:Vacuolar protein sorting 20C (Vps20C) [Monocercomonoides exilis]|uniref:Vacuolar protein sorting 20C (Vps20C) n=1 Tax=Monocercomonoides exilis TaxID=2049356 RepID=UPI00355993AD|nr:Vacuolar protein sorting 20C (Vps20C) [Monocercomonoides exilis]|eukprot:MONOS_2592.1-p1 / transcript=MONOS_2592.1 / gene=MONOS_2592 / organism=Monocercomonoides_exilis_PA203 / gene_product= Vacuolar protein sorting 20C (Vps20C) / transcript_product= Vacuolar protein sorting 20C (Vps20C) / location=Mono_scaffold00054:116852-117909(+) / protein_length=217 / sequence_SO=supercontig / SO=protein_coding / is_pseudo=false
MASFFGKKKEVPKVDIQARLQQMQRSIQTLTDRRNFLEMKSQQCLIDAKAAKQRGQKAIAVSKMKEKMSADKNLKRISGYIDNLNAVKFKLEEGVQTKVVVDAYTVADQGLTEITNDLDPDKIDDLRDNLDDKLADFEERQDSLSRPMAGVIGDEEAEAELAKELEAEIDAEWSSAPVPTNPIHGIAQPTSAVAAPTKQAAADDDELARLEAELAM